MAEETYHKPEIGKKIPEYLTLDEINEFFSVFQEDDPFELRDKTIFELLYSSGLRTFEACDLRMKDLDLDNMFLIIRVKDGRTRLVPFGEKSLVLIRKYLDTARDAILKMRSSEYMFVNQRGDNVDQKTVSRSLKKYLERTNIKKRITPNTFRHSFVVHIIENNADLRSVQELLGKIDIPTNQIFTHLASRSLKEIHEEYHK